MAELTHKECNICYRVRPVSLFYRNKNCSDGYLNQCKECTKLRKENKQLYENRTRVPYLINLLVEEKECAKCKKYKSWDRFHNSKKGVYGLASYCQQCASKYASGWYEENKEEVLKRTNKYKKDNPEKIRKQRKKYYRENKEHIVEYNRKHRKENREYYNRYYRERRKNDKGLRVKHNLKTKLNKYAKGKQSKTINELVVLDNEELREYIEDQWDEGMTWNNYGRNGWHIDHIIPKKHFDHDCPYQRAVCWHYSNLQPLWSEENESKGDTLPNPFKEIELDEEFLNKVISI